MRARLARATVRLRSAPGRLAARVRSMPKLIAVAAVVAAVVFIRSSGGSEPPLEAGPTEFLLIEGPAMIDAGDEWTFTIRDAGDDGFEAGTAPVDVHVSGPWGVRTLEIEPPDDGTVTLPGELTRGSGALAVTVRAGDATGTGLVEVAPLEPVDGTTPLAGPRSMVADGLHDVMVSALPRDRYGNSVADGTPVVVHVRRPDGSVEEVGTEVEHMLAAAEIRSRYVAGRTALRLAIEGATGPTVEVLEVPGPPIAVDLVEPTVPLRADGRMLVTVMTDVLTDSYGNVLSDGTSGVVRMAGPLGAGTLRPVSVDGRFRFVIEAPPVPGAVSVDIEVDGARSAPIELLFVSDVGELPVDATRVGDKVEVRVGPVLASGGGFVADGTVVHIRTASGEAHGDIHGGVAEMVIEVETGETIEVEVLGTTVEEEAP